MSRHSNPEYDSSISLFQGPPRPFILFTFAALDILILNASFNVVVSLFEIDQAVISKWFPPFPASVNNHIVWVLIQWQLSQSYFYLRSGWWVLTLSSVLAETFFRNQIASFSQLIQWLLMPACEQGEYNSLYFLVYQRLVSVQGHFMPIQRECIQRESALNYCSAWKLQDCGLQSFLLIDANCLLSIHTKWCSVLFVL